MVEDFEDLYENAPCGYLSLGPDGRIILANLTFSTWTGFAREDLVGKRFRDFLNVAGAMFYETHFAPLLRMQGAFNEVALDLLKADGGKLLVLANATEKRDPEGNLLFTRLTIFRATERRRWERELVEAKAIAERGLQAEQVNAELREQFLAVLGHDLRNPLAGLRAGVRLIRKDGFTDKTPAMLELMDRSVSRMDELINNVLDLTRSRLGGGLQLHIDIGKPLEPTLVQVVDELRAAYPERTLETAFALLHPIDCDHSRIGQLLSNLVGNALIHGAADTPIRVVGATGGGQFELWVANRGQPIPALTRERLFLPFHRGEALSSREGLGLGLYIASQIALAHGGRIDVDSDDIETRFTFRMPINS